MFRMIEPAVGIDLGTTYSVIAALDDLGRPKTVVNAEGDKLTPSVVLFEGTDVVVGKEAVKALTTDASQIAECAKRDLGQRVYHKILGGRQYPPEALQACVLNKLRMDSSRQLGEYSKVVITVPAYFDEVRRKATQDAGYIAGLDVIDIINEPTAAALAYGLQAGFLTLTGNVPELRRVLVYDLGGGTFDVTVMELQGRSFNTLATDGDVQLGGRDWDQRMMDYVAERMVALAGFDPRQDINHEGRLWRECEEAKRTLTARQRATISWEWRGQPLRVEVTREKFEELTLDLLERTAFTTRQTLQAAGLTWDQIDHVLLVGGSTRMPSVVHMLKQLSGKTPDRSLSPDEAVAHGAALRAGWLLAQEAGETPPFRIRNVNSHSLGVVAVEAQTKRLRNAILIPRNTPLPVAAERVFKTQQPSQRSILVQIVEGESTAPEDCLPIGKCVVRQLPPHLPAMTPVKVRFRYEENGRLQVAVSCAGKTLQHELTRDNSLTPAQLGSWRQFITGRRD